MASPHAVICGALALAGCGRIGFDGLRDGSAGSPYGIDGLDPSLRIWFALDDLVSSATTDSTGLARNATCTTGRCPTLGVGKWDGGMVFDGTGNYFKMDNPQLPVDDYTWEVWVNGTANISFSGLLVSRGVDGISPGGLELDLDSPLNPAVWANGAQVHASTSIPFNVWTHIALTRAGSTQRLFVNAIEVSSATVAGPHDFAACPLLIGMDNDSGCEGTIFSDLEGTLDDVRIYARARTPAELASDMASPRP